MKKCIGPETETSLPISPAKGPGRPTDPTQYLV